MMRAWCAAALWLIASMASADPYGKDWPDGPNRELAGALCGACHSLKLVQQQRLDREGWDALLVWMTKKQGMADLPPSIRDPILDYLAASFGRDGNGGGRRLLADTDAGLQGLDVGPLVEP